MHGQPHIRFKICWVDKFFLFFYMKPLSPNVFFRLGYTHYPPPYAVSYVIECMTYLKFSRAQKYVTSIRSVSCTIHAHAVIMWMHIQYGSLQSDGVAVHKTYIRGYELCHAAGDLWCINPLTPNDHYSGRTAPLTSKVSFYIFIQQI